MAPSRGDLAIYQGDDYSGVVTVTSPGVDPGAVINGYTATAEIRQGTADQTPNILCTINTSVSSPNILLSIPHAQTQALPAGYILYWDLQITSPTGMATTILAGWVIVQRDISR